MNHSCGLDLEKIGQKYRNASVTDEAAMRSYAKDVEEVYEKCPACRTGKSRT